MDEKARAAVLQWLQLTDDHAKLCEKNARACATAADLVQELVARSLYRLLDEENARAGNAGRRRGIPLEADRALLRVARPVQSLVIRMQPDGSGQIVIDSAEPFELPAKLTRLLAFAASGKAGADGVAGYRDIVEVAKALGTNKHNVSQMVYRLRRELYRNHWNPRLLETSHSDESGSKLRFRTRQTYVIDEPLDVITSAVADE